MAAESKNRSESASPLADLHRELGAHLAPYRGLDRPANYGNSKTEIESLQTGCGLFDRQGVELFEMQGEDRHRFLNAYVTCDVKELASGRGTYGFITSAKGRILADLKVLATEDRFFLEFPPGIGEEVVAHLTKYIIVDRVEIEHRGDLLPWTLLGPETPATLKGLGEEFTEELAVYESRTLPVGGVEVLWVRDVDLGVPSHTLWVPVSEAEAFGRELLASSKAPVPVGHQALEHLRVTAGHPLFGQDFDGENFPKETGLEEQAVSYTKGCYLGQEVVARIHYRGGVNKSLRGLRFQQPDAEVSVPRAVLVEGREAGQMTSVASMGAEGLGLGILHKRAESGALVEVDGIGEAQVVDLPFPVEG